MRKFAIQFKSEGYTSTMTVWAESEAQALEMMRADKRERVIKVTPQEASADDRALCFVTSTGSRVFIAGFRRGRTSRQYWAEGGAQFSSETGDKYTAAVSLERVNANIRSARWERV